jgi:hypothetical protein
MPRGEILVSKLNSSLTSPKKTMVISPVGKPKPDRLYTFLL